MTAPTIPLFGFQSVHLFRFDPAAVAVPSRGNKVGDKYRMGAYKCVACKVLESFAADWADCDCCPGWAEPAAAIAPPAGTWQPELPELTEDSQAA